MARLISGEVYYVGGAVLGGIPVIPGVAGHTASPVCGPSAPPPPAARRSATKTPGMANIHPLCFPSQTWSKHLAADHLEFY